MHKNILMVSRRLETYEWKMQENISSLSSLPPYTFCWSHEGAFVSFLWNRSYITGVGGSKTHILCKEELCSSCINSSVQLLWSSTAEKGVLMGWPLVPTHYFGCDVQDCSSSLLQWPPEAAVNHCEVENVLTACFLKGLTQWGQVFHYRLKVEVLKLSWSSDMGTL